ncbi:MAG TPA: PPOX class F420-dependent oxidoreductase [Acidimicrobiales bacterium]|jgi:PPOX class probable F420-dependent enzyme|nr:PPOX class F420-dependent oxidoreductase [Acidimicrobiales bacterium]
MELTQALAFAHARQRGVLTTIRRDGRPQLSNIMYVPNDDDFLISVTDSRAKTKNLRRDPRAALYVPGDDFWNFVVLDGTVELSGVATRVDDDVTAQLVDYFRRGAGEHPDWDDFKATMVKEGRVLATFRPTTAYGMIQG